MHTIDRRTRSDTDVRHVDARTFFDDWFPALRAAHGRTVAAGIRHLDAPPLTLYIDGDRYSIREADGDIHASRGAHPGGLTIALPAELFSDLAQELLSLNAMAVANTLRRTEGTFHDLAAWDALWRSLLTGWPVSPEGVDFHDRSGETLDLHRAFTPTDDPADIAHFLREAGYVHLRRWLEPDAMEAIARDVTTALPSYREGDGRSWWATVSDGSARCVRMQHFVEHSPTTAELLDSSRWQQLRSALAGQEELLQGPVAGNCIEALVKPLGVIKGISDVPWHRDCNFGRHSYACSGTIVGISVTAGNERSGRLRTVAGSHRVAMPPPTNRRPSYLPVVELPTEVGDLTVHLSCTLHEATPPTAEERIVMYTGFGLEPRVGATAGGAAIRDLRERAHLITSQPPSRLNESG